MVMIMVMLHRCYTSREVVHCELGSPGHEEDVEVSTVW